MLRSLTHLHLDIGAPPLRHHQRHFPFHQLHHLTIYYSMYMPLSQWKQIAEASLALPLSRSEMPLLRVLELEWFANGVQSRSIPTSDRRQYLSFLDYLESSTLEFERLGVQFQEIYPRSIYRMPTPMKDVIEQARDTIGI